MGSNHLLIVMFFGMPDMSNHFYGNYVSIKPLWITDTAQKSMYRCQKQQRYSQVYKGIRDDI